MRQANAEKDDVSIIWQTTGLETDRVTCAIVLPTYRRPGHLAETLRSLAAQEASRSFAVVVVENDAAGGEGAQAGRAVLAEVELPGIVVIARRQGNCHAYNAGFETALAQFPDIETVAVIDDDELADPRWLEALHRTAAETGADLVGGPQRPLFNPASPPAARRHPVFQPHYDRTGPVPILYSSGNVLIAKRVLATMPRPILDPAFNFIGGGDSDFYRRCREAGFTFAWAEEAAVMETTPLIRTSRQWLTARSLRNGAISAILDRRARPGLAGRLRVVAKSTALLATALPRGIPLALKRRSILAGLYHLHVALGRFQAEFGRINEQYRKPEEL